MDKNIFHTLQGEKIYFTPLSLEDVVAIHSYASNPDVSRFIGWQLKNDLKDTHSYIEEMLRREVAGTHLYATVVKKDSNEVIGTVMLFGFDHEAKQAEVGYVLHQDFWGKGYCTEAVAMINNFAINNLKLHRLHARVVGGNMGSARVLEKNGFDLEGRLSDHYYIEGKYYDGLIFGKLLGAKKQ
ncbi:GNAT family N-acetyltransferase [Clostridium sp. OS1-26]|uniref:GNAT family N-acetyltransferase n=1 Tax=Clostridium sp. OS1-26 TaxID=3070681 RepID=UPI0027E06A23|nr:GNAT family N-acetyltransferase [Clostridium sp. OS1-26]WML36844.1 GNAT family N-acetyltransferase [Clostridium sp. OS1-26]